MTMASPKNLLTYTAQRSIELLMALDLALIVIIVFSNVVARYCFSSGFDGAEELSRLLFVWLVFLGSILALRDRAHLGMELVQALLPRGLRRICSVITHLLMLYALWLFFYGSWHQTVIGLHNYSTVLHYPTALMASAGLVCAASMMLIVALNLVRVLINSPKAQVAGDPNPDLLPVEALHGNNQNAGRNP